MLDSNLLKEAIADAKAVRQTALANAKVALEEAFSEKYNAMFAEKLREDAGMMPKQSETEVKSEENIGEQEIDELIKELESEVGDEAVPLTPPSNVPATPGASEEPPVAPGAPAAPAAACPPGFKVVCVPVSTPPVAGEIPAPGQSPDASGIPPAAPTLPPSEVPPVSGEETDEEINLDELLQSLKEEVEGKEEKEEETKKLDEEKKLNTSAIAPGNNKKPSASASSTSGISSGGLTDHGVPDGKVIAKDPTEVTKPDVNFGANKDGNLAKKSHPLKETIGLKDNGIPGSEKISEDPTDASKSEENFNGNKDGNLAKKSHPLKEENDNLKTQLNEAEETIKYVKTQLNEINLLNAKLLYTNKLFKEYNMNNEHKMRIIEMFDLSKNVREVKMTYANLAETLNFGGIDTKKKVSQPTSVQSITEGLASKSVGSTKPSKEIISESKSSAMVTKFQKLAGIKKS